MYPSDYRFSKEHEWARLEEDHCVVGVSYYAQDELGEVVFVELPEVGKAFAANDEMGTIESVKAVAELYTPVAGEVVEVNESLAEAPELINEEPHGKGWLVKIRLSTPSDLEQLMSAEEYEKYLESGGE